jgi:hypothetical protein
MPLGPLGPGLGTAATSPGGGTIHPSLATAGFFGGIIGGPTPMGSPLRPWARRSDLSPLPTPEETP